ncbi:uncharacterized protein LOC130361144 isoform X2 [Hyla sarda]|uniref:uncharacterized protein LOC130361144 isoform X2 n=1 Tax=Hyla sarda TaxID=327740 RepID=UPI0024C38B9C|nr:uncharacterized protein LOC130361144 isoform X2 [Hyla sarda]
METIREERELGTMRQLLALRVAFNLWLAISFSSGQSGDDILADLGSGYILDTPQDQPKESRNPPKDTNHCQLTFVTPRQEPCVDKDNSNRIKEDVKYLQNLLQDHDRVLQSLKYTVNADAQDLGYQQVISEHNKGIREDNKEFYGTLNKIIQELHTRMDDDDGTEVLDEKKKLKKNFLTMNHLLQTTFQLAETLDKKSQDLDVLLAKQLERSTTLAYRNMLRS